MNQRGFTLVELLITIVIASIAMMALAVPFVAERTSFLSGRAQAEAQRDAEICLRAIARVAREGIAYDATVPGRLSFTVPCGPSPTTGTATFELHDGGLFHLHDCTGNEVTLIDGVRSQIANFTATNVTSKLVRIHLECAHASPLSSGRVENEVLDTEIFLRNGT